MGIHLSCIGFEKVREKDCFGQNNLVNGRWLYKLVLAEKLNDILEGVLVIG